MNHIILNNKFMFSNEFKWDISDGLLYGYGVFETILLKDNKLIYLREHYDRLIKSVEKLKINMDLNFEQLNSSLNFYIQKNSLENSILRVTIFKNSDSFDILITHRENKYNSSHYKLGFKMEISEFKRNPSSILSGIKSVNYLENIYALREAKKLGSHEVLFLDYKNYVSEGATSNIFFIKDKIIYTPTKECGLLQGIIRRKVIDIIEINKNLQLKQGFFSLKKLLEADEVFLTNSIMGIMPVSKIKHTTYDLKKNHITNLLIEKLNKY